MHDWKSALCELAEAMRLVVNSSLLRELLLHARCSFRNIPR